MSCMYGIWIDSLKMIKDIIGGEAITNAGPIENELSIFSPEILTGGKLEE